MSRWQPAKLSSFVKWTLEWSVCICVVKIRQPKGIPGILDFWWWDGEQDQAVVGTGGEICITVSNARNWRSLTIASLSSFQVTFCNCIGVIFILICEFVYTWVFYHDSLVPSSIIHVSKNHWHCFEHSSGVKLILESVNQSLCLCDDG